MMEEKQGKAVPTPTQATPQENPPFFTPKPKPVYDITGRERGLLPLLWALAVLLVHLAFCARVATAGLGITVFIAAFYGVLIWYVGPEKFGGRSSLVLLGAIMLLSLTYSVYSNQWFRYYNVGALALLITIHVFGVAGGAQYPWHRPIMLLERTILLLDGLFGHMGATVAAVTCHEKKGGKRVLYALLGVAIGLPLLMFVTILLATADALFNDAAGWAITFFFNTFGDLAVRLVLGLVLLPLGYSLYYTLRHPITLKATLLPKKDRKADPILPVIVLALLDLLYALFAAVQSAVLFGGAAYVEARGITFADYARSGFFQLIFVAAMNLTIVMIALQFTKKEGKLWQLTRILATVTVALSGVMLASAAVRMTLYVTTYGLSFKRLLTYWGMAMVAAFFAIALVKIWRRDFSFFKVAGAVALGGWLVLNFCNTDAIVARYNVEQYLQQQAAGEEMPKMNLDYLADFLSYAALPELSRLPADTPVYVTYRQDSAYTVGQLVAGRRQAAARDSASWETWSVSACLAAYG
ncbi:MAG: DUF4173 domain-containing protein [Oscillospiraceae bacterium]